MKNTGRAFLPGRRRWRSAPACSASAGLRRRRTKKQTRAAREAARSPPPRSWSARPSIASTQALDAFNAHDKANDWTDQACAESRSIRGRGVGERERQVPGGDLRRGSRLPALRGRQGGQGPLPAGPLRRARSSTTRAPSSPSTSSRPTATPTRRSARSSRRSPTRTSRTFRRSSTSPCSRCSATPTGRRELPRQGRRQGRGPSGLRLREAEPPARAGHRRRLHAGVQPAGALLLRQREEEGQPRPQVRSAPSPPTRRWRSAVTCSSSSWRRSSAPRRCARTPTTRRFTTRRVSS